MSKFKFNAVIVGLFLLLGGCSSGMQSNNGSSSDVGTAWGGDVHSSVQSVSVERADREPAEMVVINYSTQYPSGYDKVYSIRISDLEYAVRDANFNSIPITRRYNASMGQWQYSIQAFYDSLTLSDGGVNTLSNQQSIFNAKQWKIHQGYI
ncbi:hypothetical protein MJI95_21125, partial [Salmonella enterica subsp. enterica serovar Kentucky]|nr:hypothetical protein [Salmonella enterica subsp. enterica serovar Kentucky]